MENRPKKIKMELLPADDLDVSALLNELAANGLLSFYGENDRLIWICGFSKHQNPHKDEKASVLPPHPDDLSSDHAGAEEAPCKHGASTVQDSCLHGVGAEEAPYLHDANPADSRFPIPDSRFPTDTETEPRESESARNAQAPVGESGQPPSSPEVPPERSRAAPSKAQKREQGLDELMRLTGDPPHYRDWWRDVLELLDSTRGGSVLKQAIKSVERASPGSLAHPGKVIGKRIDAHLKKHGKRLPAPPKAREDCA
jgi:hypothetical protein